MKPLILEEEDIRKLLDKDEIIDVVEKSFIQFSMGNAVMPTPHDLILKEGETHVKSAYIEGENLYCIKIASGFYGNPKALLSSSQGMMILLDVKTGLIKCIILENGLLTDYRTAAAGAIAAKYLAKKNSSRVFVMGTGIQARLQVEFLLRVFTIKKLFVWGRNRANTEKYCNEISRSLTIEIVNNNELPENIDIIILTTPSRRPILNNIMEGVHVNAIGSDMPGKQELDEKILLDAKIVTDSTNQCAKSGELQHAIGKGKMKLDQVHAELGEVICKKKRGRENSKEITIYDSTGLGVQDLAIAQYVYKKFNQG